MAKSSKSGRNKVKCQAYRANGTREKNKARKAATLARGLARAKESRELLMRIRETLQAAEDAMHAEFAN
jgi:RNA polymerase-interacting CarD/CdnL/TRCF family regulator